MNRCKYCGRDLNEDAYLPFRGAGFCDYPCEEGYRCCHAFGDKSPYEKKLQEFHDNLRV